MTDGLWEIITGWLAGPGREPLVCAAAGLLGAVVNCTLENRPLMLPHAHGNRVELGFLGNLAVCMVVAGIADHGFQTAFLGALCGSVILRAAKRRVEGVFEEELERSQRGKR